MRSATYLQHVRRDGERLLEVAQRDLSAEVPSCPDWDVADLLTHTASVYAHKVACLQLSRRPDTGEWDTEAPDGDVVEWFRDMHRNLLDELSGQRPESPAWTWFGPNQTVGFWHRRMAHETAVHRYDAELAVGDVSPIDAELAVDGVDELIGFVCGPWGEDPIEGASGRTVAVATADREWSLTLDSSQVVLNSGAVAEARVSGDPQSVLLWLWGSRVPDEAVGVEGDVALVRELRGRLDNETS